MQTLDIECPSCGEMLELDAGFAGGVCRCSNCGTLMTVPSDAGQAESLTRPTSSASVGAGGLSSMGVPDPGATRSRTSRSKKGKTKKGRPLSATIEAGEYRTASGKVIRVDESTRVPMAESKKKQIRMATTIVFFSIVAAVVAVAVVGIIAITGGPGGPGGGSGDTAYDPAANPYTLEFANVMGLPITDRTVVIVEATEYSDEWKKAAGEMVGAGLSQKPKDGEVTLIGAGTAPIKFAGGSFQEMPMPAGKVRDWFGKLPADGQGDVVAAISEGLALDPQTIIVMHGYTEMSSIEAWDALVKDRDGLKIHIVHLGNSSPELEGWAGERGGEAVVLSVDQIEYLKEAAAEEETSEEE